MKSLLNVLLFCCKPANTEANPGEASATDQSKAKAFKEASLHDPPQLKGNCEEVKGDNDDFGKREAGGIGGKRGKLPTIRLVGPGEDKSVILFSVIPEISTQKPKKLHEHKKKHKRKPKNSASESH